MKTLPFQRRCSTRKEYDRLGELGVFRPGEPAELIAGELIVSEPKGSLHASAVGLTTEKASLYARAGVPDYWIVNLVDRALEIHREPVPDASAPLGWRYAVVDVLSPGSTVSPLARPTARIAVHLGGTLTDPTHARLAIPALQWELHGRRMHEPLPVYNSSGWRARSDESRSPPARVRGASSAIWDVSINRKTRQGDAPWRTSSSSAAFRSP